MAPQTRQQPVPSWKVRENNSIQQAGVVSGIAPPTGPRLNQNSAEPFRTKIIPPQSLELTSLKRPGTPDNSQPLKHQCGTDGIRVPREPLAAQPSPPDELSVAQSLDSSLRLSHIVVEELAEYRRMCKIKKDLDLEITEYKQLGIPYDHLAGRQSAITQNLAAQTQRHGKAKAQYESRVSTFNKALDGDMTRIAQEVVNIFAAKDCTKEERFTEITRKWFQDMNHRIDERLTQQDHYKRQFDENMTRQLEAMELRVNQKLDIVRKEVEHNKQQLDTTKSELKAVKIEWQHNKTQLSVCETARDTFKKELEEYRRQLDLVTTRLDQSTTDQNKLVIEVNKAEVELQDARSEAQNAKLGVEKLEDKLKLLEDMQKDELLKDAVQQDNKAECLEDKFSHFEQIMKEMSEVLIQTGLKHEELQMSVMKDRLRQYESSGVSKAELTALEDQLAALHERTSGKTITKDNILEALEELPLDSLTKLRGQAQHNDVSTNTVGRDGFLELQLRISALEAQSKEAGAQIQLQQGCTTKQQLEVNELQRQQGTLTHSLQHNHKVHETNQDAIKVLMHRFNNLYTVDLAKYIIEHIRNAHPELGSTDLTHSVQELSRQTDTMRVVVNQTCSDMVYIKQQLANTVLASQQAMRQPQSLQPTQLNMGTVQHTVRPVGQQAMVAGMRGPNGTSDQQRNSSTRQS